MTSRTAMLHVRVDNDVKEQATLALTAIGLSMSVAVRLFLRRVVIEQAFPLELKLPEGQTPVGKDELEAMRASHRARSATCNALFADLGKNSGQ